MTSYTSKYRIDHLARYQGSHPSVCGQVEVEKYATGHHYSEVTSSGWSKSKRYLTQKNTNTFYHSILTGSINTTTMKDPLKLALYITVQVS